MDCDLRPCIQTMACEPVTLIQTKTGTYAKGRWTDGDKLESEIVASVQPISGKDLQFLPEGFRIGSTVKVYTGTFIFPGDRENQRSPDRIRYKGNIYEFRTVEDWWTQGKYYKGIATIVKENQ